MPTGVPANQLTQDEKRALYLIVLKVFLDDLIPDSIDRNDLVSAYYKLAAQVNQPAMKMHRRKVKKGTMKKVKEDTK